MGTKIKGMVDDVKRVVLMKNLFNKRIAIDAFNVIYQFISIIKGSDGRPLTDRNRNVTSHLSGLLYRNINLLENNIKPIYCFDGIRKSEKLRWKNKQTVEKVKLTSNMIGNSKELLDSMGIPWIQGTSEGEAQCCYLVEKGDAFAVASQDYDCLAFGGKRLLRNFAIGRTKKKGNTNIKLDIEYVSLEKFLKHHEITKEQLIDISILIGNDFFCGFKTFGEKRALHVIKTFDKIEDAINVKLVKRDKTVFESADEFYETLEEIREIYTNPLVNKDYIIKFNKPDYDKLTEILVEEHNFSYDRISSAILRLKKINASSKKQITIGEFLKNKS